MAKTSPSLSLMAAGFLLVLLSFSLCFVFPPAVRWSTAEGQLVRQLWYGFGMDRDAYELANCLRFYRWQDPNGKRSDALGLEFNWLSYRLEDIRMVADLDAHVARLDAFLQAAKGGAFPRPIYLFRPWHWLLVYGCFVAGLLLWVLGLRRHRQAIFVQRNVGDAATPLP
jgi:hypothetical protein